MQVHCDEGVANRIDLESCAGGREVAGEALTEAHAGQGFPAPDRQSEIGAAASVHLPTDGPATGSSFLLQ